MLLLLSRFSSVRLCDPTDSSSPPGSPIPGILQARTLEWVAISFSNAWKWKVKVKSFSRVWLLVTPWTAAHQAPLSMRFSRQEYWSRLPLPSPSKCAEFRKPLGSPTFCGSVFFFLKSPTRKVPLVVDRAVAPHRRHVLLHLRHRHACRTLPGSVLRSGQFNEATSQRPFTSSSLTPTSHVQYQLISTPSQDLFFLYLNFCVFTIKHHGYSQ